MPTARLSPLDASFLAVETPTAHMHVGWVAVFEPPADRRTPTFAEFRDHIASRLPRTPRDRPLWQICIADLLEDGRIGVIGKAHHCMVDGIAAVELAMLMVDPDPDPPPPEPDGWIPEP